MNRVNGESETRAVIDEFFHEGERQLLSLLVQRAWIRLRDDPDMQDHAAELVGIMRKLNGDDVVLIARRL